MGRATDLENIRLRAELLHERGVTEPAPAMFDEIQELCELILGLVDEIDRLKVDQPGKNL